MSQADVPQFMSYQGVLRDASGNPVPDGSYSVEFNLYDVETGGASLWTETHSITATSGIVEAHLGSLVSFEGIPFDMPYWLGISVGGEAELAPRTALATVPYASYADTAAECIEGDADWTIDGSNVYHEVGNVGIGTSTPVVRLDILEAGSRCAQLENSVSGPFAHTLRARNNSGPVIGLYAGSVPLTSAASPSALYAVTDVGYYGGYFRTEDMPAVYAWASDGYALQARTSAGDCALFSGGRAIFDGGLRTATFELYGTATPGHVLTADASGYGTWQPVPTGADGDWTIAGSDMYSGVSGGVGIGSTNPLGKLDIWNETEGTALRVTHAVGTITPIIDVERTTTHASGIDVVQLTIPAGSSDTSQFIECERGFATMFAVNGDGSIVSDSGAEFSGAVSVNTSTDVAGLFTSNAVSYDDTKILCGISTAGSAGNVIGVYGESYPDDGSGVGCKGVGGYRGVYGQVLAEVTDSYPHHGVHGSAEGGAGTNHGISGYAAGGPTNYGVYGSTGGGASSYAGYFSGNAHVTGTLTAATKSFMIDHPLDPGNKYLQHSSVESDEMMNIYNGNVVLDARGEAWVEMPDWFEALNQDFRYQLTCIGGFAPVYVAREISGGRFMVAGGEPGLKVSWLVTGIRHDPVALANPMSVERDKPAHESGKYLNPEAYGQPETMAVDYSEEREL